MQNLTNHITVARELAATNEPDMRIRALIEAIVVEPDSPVPPAPSISIYCHLRSWHKRIKPEEGAALQKLSLEELAAELAGWVQQALETGLLTLSNPPMVTRNGVPFTAGHPDFTSAVGLCTTFTYDSHGDVIASRTG